GTTSETKQPFVIQNRQGFQGMPGMGTVQAFAGDGRGVITTTFRTDERFTTRHQEGSLIITMTGPGDDGKAKVTEMQVQDGGTSKKYHRVSEVPEQYRDKVKNLADMNEKSSIKIEIKPERKREEQKKKEEPRKRKPDADGDAI